MDNEQNYQSPHTGGQIDQAIEWALAPTAAKVKLSPVSGMTADNVQGAVAELFQSVSDGKALIASAVTDKGVPTAADATFQEIHDNILGIESGGGAPENMHTITLTADPPEGGTVSGGGMASDGMTVTVSAQAASGHFFNSWQENGEFLSKIPELSVKLLADRTLTSVFLTSKLPDGYQEIEYIQSNRAQYVDTGVIPNWNTKIVLDGQVILQPSPTSDDASDCIFGSRPTGLGGTDGRDIFLEVFKPGYVPFRYYFCGDGESVISISVSDVFSRYTFTLSKLEATIGGNTDTEYAPTESTNISKLSIFLFAVKLSDGTAALPSAFRLYSGKFYDSDVLIRDFVPCKNPSGEIGLYDLVGEQFYGNLGTGAFVPGPAV